MKALAVVLSLALAGTVCGQGVQRGFGSVVFPGGTSGGGVTRNFGSVVFPGGAQMQPVYGGGASVITRFGSGGGNPVPPGRGQNRNGRPPGNGRGAGLPPVYVYAYPLYVGGYDNSYAPQDPGLQQPPPQQPNVVVVYPAQQQANPVMIQAGPDGGYTTSGQRQPATIYEAPPQRDAVDVPEPANDSPRYLLAFKDHSIYSAVAYWADGDTLHYFTTGNIHNQASMSLLDRDLTERLNRDLGIDFKLPAAK